MEKLKLVLLASLLLLRILKVVCNTIILFHCCRLRKEQIQVLAYLQRRKKKESWGTVKQWRLPFPSAQFAEVLGQDNNNYSYKSALGNFTEVSSLPSADVTD